MRVGFSTGVKGRVKGKIESIVRNYRNPALVIRRCCNHFKPWVTTKSRRTVLTTSPLLSALHPRLPSLLLLCRNGGRRDRTFEGVRPSSTSLGRQSRRPAREQRRVIGWMTEPPPSSKPKCGDGYRKAIRGLACGIGEVNLDYGYGDLQLLHNIPVPRMSSSHLSRLSVIGIGPPAPLQRSTILKPLLLS